MVSAMSFSAWDVEHRRALIEEGETGVLVPVSIRQALEGYAAECLCQARQRVADSDVCAEIQRNAESILDRFEVNRRGLSADWAPVDARHTGADWTEEKDESLRQLVLACMSIEAIATLLYRRGEEIVARVRVIIGREGGAQATRPCGVDGDTAAATPSRAHQADAGAGLDSLVSV